MILTHEDAINQKCCTAVRFCQGKDCMAWKEETSPQEVLKESKSGARVEVAQVFTGKGYCGLVYR